jgi:hypothetical protein
MFGESEKEKGTPVIEKHFPTFSATDELTSLAEVQAFLMGL